MADEPVIVLHGPRSVDKSTLQHDLADDLAASVVDLDEPAVRQAVSADPMLYTTTPSPVLIDEFQHVPSVLDAIKAEPNRKLRGVEDDQAGVQAAGTDRWHADRVEPAGHRRTRWFSDFVRLVVERDARDIRRVRQRDALPLLLQRLAAQTASVLNTTDLARRTQMERTVVDDYLQVLEAVFMIHRLPALDRTLGARVGRSPKLHLVDSGLAATLAGLTEQRLAARDTAALAEFDHVPETFVVRGDPQAGEPERRAAAGQPLPHA